MHDVSSRQWQGAAPCTGFERSGRDAPATRAAPGAARTERHNAGRQSILPGGDQGRSDNYWTIDESGQFFDSDARLQGGPGFFAEVGAPRIWICQDLSDAFDSGQTEL